jgi:hypothetical protein
MSLDKFSYLANNHANSYYNISKTENQQVKFTLQDKEEGISQISTTNKRHTVVPLLFYNRININYLLKFNTEKQSRIIQEKLLKLMDSAGVMKQLVNKQQSLEINFEKIPTNIEYLENEHIIYFGIWYVQIGKEILQPTDNDIVVEIKIVENNKIVRTKKITATCDPLVIKNKFFSYQRFMDVFLTERDKNIRRASRKLFNDIYKEIN